MRSAVSVASGRSETSLIRSPSTSTWCPSRRSFDCPSRTLALAKRMLAIVAFSLPCRIVSDAGLV